MAKTQESKRVRTGESGQGAAAAGGMDVESGERCSASLQKCRSCVGVTSVADLTDT